MFLLKKRTSSTKAKYLILSYIRDYYRANKRSVVQFVDFENRYKNFLKLLNRIKQVPFFFWEFAPGYKLKRKKGRPMKISTKYKELKDIFWGV